MRFLILAHHEDATAIGVAAALRRRHAPNQIRVVSLDEIVLAPKWVYRIEEGHTCTELILHDGTVIQSHDIGVVFNRLQYVSMPHFTTAKREDRDYATMEMFALLVSWLAGLPCPVMNPVSSEGLNGPVYSSAKWQILAGKVGLPVFRFGMTSSVRRFPINNGLTRVPITSSATGSYGHTPPTLPTGHYPANFFEPLSDNVHTALVVGHRVFGGLPDDLTLACRHLADLTGLALLRLYFSSSRQGKAAWIFTGADPFPHITDTQSLCSLMLLLEERSERSHTASRMVEP